MANFKADITLNERDALLDLLNTEKSLMALYSQALSEGCSKGYREEINDIFRDTSFDQLKVFLMLTDKGYTKVKSASEEEKQAVSDAFSKVENQLY